VRECRLTSLLKSEFGSELDSALTERHEPERAKQLLAPIKVGRPIQNRDDLIECFKRNGIELKMYMHRQVRVRIEECTTTPRRLLERLFESEAEDLVFRKIDGREVLVEQTKSEILDYWLEKLK
jgi:hypothetical protein